jgi:hypothetical protein
MSEGPKEYPESEIPKVFMEGKEPDETEVERAIIRQTTNARSRTVDYDDNPEAIGQDWPALKGHEEKLLELANKTATKQVSEIAEIPSPPKRSPEPLRLANSSPPASFGEEAEQWDSPEQIQQERERVWIEGFNRMGENARRAYEAKQKHPPPVAPQSPASERQSRRDLLRGKSRKSVPGHKSQRPVSNPAKAR